MQGAPGRKLMGRALPAAPTGYLKPRAEEERRVAAEEKKRQDELKRIERELAEGTGSESDRLALHPDFLGRTSPPSDLRGAQGVVQGRGRRTGRTVSL